MKTFEKEGVEVDQCISCGGFWLDQGELQRLVGVEPEEQRILNCPSCKAHMTTLQLKGVELDYCPACEGFFLDRGELEDLSNPELDEFRSWLDLKRNVELAKDPDGKLGCTVLDHMFVMAKSGVLVASFVQKADLALDEELLAGMLTAIQDFVQTAFASMSKLTLNAIDVGEKRLLLERGDYIMMAAVVAGSEEAAREYRKTMKATIAGVEGRHKEELAAWDGDVENLRDVRDEVGKSLC